MPAYLEVAFFLAPGLAVMTLPAASWAAPLLVTGCLGGGFAMSHRARSLQCPDLAKARFEARARSLVGDRKGYVSDFRGGLVLLTCLAILAVDFPCFDRKHAKTETFGISLMDTGVGLYVFSSGLASAAARASLLAPRHRSPSPSERRRPGGSSSGRGGGGQKHRTTLGLPPGVSPALAIGVVRMVALKQANYQEHASEYGLHWNFFLSLACAWTLAAAVRWSLAALAPAWDAACSWRVMEPTASSSSKRPATRALALKRGRSGASVWLAGTGLLAAYQAALLAHGGALTAWVMESPRHVGGDGAALAFVRANREGLLQVVPLTALYLAAQEVGARFVWLPRALRVKPRQLCGWGLASGASLAAAALGAWALCGIAWLGLQPPSRRLVNPAYVLLVLAVGTSLVALVLAAHAAAAAVPRSATLVAMGDHQLAAFVAANLITGAVNLSPLDTLRTGPATARLVLACHVVLVAAAARAAAARREATGIQAVGSVEERGGKKPTHSGVRNERESKRKL